MLLQTAVRTARTDHFPPRRRLCHQPGPMRRRRKRLQRRVHRLSTTRLDLNQHLRSSCRPPRISNLRAKLEMAHHLTSQLKLLNDQHGFVLINLSDFCQAYLLSIRKGPHILVFSPVYQLLQFSSLISMASGPLNGFHDVCSCSTHFLSFSLFFWGQGMGRILAFSMISTDFPCLILSLIFHKVLYPIIV